MTIETKFNIGDKAFAAVIDEGDKGKMVEIPIERIYIVVNANGVVTHYTWSDDDGRVYELPEYMLYTSEEEYQQQKKEYEQRKYGKRKN